MGAGSKFASNLSTRGGRAGFITSSDISSGNPLAKEILGEMSKEGIKYSKDKIVFAAKLENGNKIFLEKGGLKHIIDGHSKNFQEAFGISESQIEKHLCDTISKGKLVSSKVKIVNGIPFYSNKYYHNGKFSVVYGIADNGYIETAYPRPYKGGIK